MARSFVAVVALSLALVAFPNAQAVSVPPLKQPAWAELAQDQKMILAPLASEWDRLEPWRKKKWLGIAQRYPGMKADEQERVQRRMKDWVKLSSEERKAVREKYKKLTQASPEHKEALIQKWQEYKELPEEEKQRLREQAIRSKPQPKPGSIRKPNPPTAAIPAGTLPVPPVVAPATATETTSAPTAPPPSNEPQPEPSPPPVPTPPPSQ